MLSWPAPQRSVLPGRGPEVRLHDTATGRLAVAAGGSPASGSLATMYVCGITPYDSAHLGHAATYVAFDLLHRAWLDAGHRVRYAQNVTDVDDPLLARARATGVDWHDLAVTQTTVFCDDMLALGVLPPSDLVSVTEAMTDVGAVVSKLVAAGVTYEVPLSAVAARDSGAGDIYVDLTSDADLGSVSGLDAAAMLPLFAERGGDPDRPGKRHPLDALLWRAARAGEPSWSVPGLPDGRPGWHVECVAIAFDRLGSVFDVQGGGTDLIFPHHELGASHARMLSAPFARRYAHAGMVGLDGEKMSKSQGNLVFVHRLLAEGMPAPAIRLGLLAHHYRSDWSWDGVGREAAVARLARWQAAVSRTRSAPGERVLAEVRAALADDLDAPRALAAVDDWCAATEAGGDDEAAPGLVSRLVDTLLGVRL